MLLLAGGQGTRLNAEAPKPYVGLAGSTLVERSAARLAAWAKHAALDAEILLAIDPAARDRHLPPLWGNLQDLGVEQAVDGGATRHQSMLRAHAATARPFDVLVVHDAARPFFSIQAATTLIREATGVGAALLAAPLADTLKRAHTGTTRIEATLDRQNLWLAQTPQAIRTDVFENALAQAGPNFRGTDDVSMVEAAGLPVAIVESSPLNFKITRAADLQLAQALLAAHGEDFADDS